MHESYLDLRSPGGFLAMLLFAVVLGAVFAYAMEPGVFRSDQNLAGVLIASLFFSASIQASHSTSSEKESGALAVLFLSAADPAGIFLGKVLARWQIQLVLILAVVPIYGFLLGGSPTTGFDFVFFATLMLALVSLSLAALGILLQYVARGNRLRDVLFPVLLFPASIPVMILGVDFVQTAPGPGEDWPGFLRSCLVLAAPAGIYGALGMLIFSAVGSEED